MKVFFDTNVYVAEALQGSAAERLVRSTLAASWRIVASHYLLAELERVLVEHFNVSRRGATLTARRVRRRSMIVEPGSSRHYVPGDPADSPILQAALAASADYLVSNDAHLLAVSPYEGLKILSMADYHQLLEQHGLLR